LYNVVNDFVLFHYVDMQPFFTAFINKPDHVNGLKF